VVEVVPRIGARLRDLFTADIVLVVCPRLVVLPVAPFS
jgi:hypothetical protein